MASDDFLVVPGSLAQQSTPLELFSEELSKVRDRVNDLMNSLATAAGSDDIGNEFLHNVLPPVQNMQTLASQSGQVLKATHANLGVSDTIFANADDEALNTARGFTAP